MVNAQEWLDKNYPKEKRNWIWEIYLDESSLEGELDLGDFTYEHRIMVYISFQLDETKLVLKNLSEKAKIVKLVQAQEYIDKQYPDKEQREEIKELNIDNLNRDKNLVGELDLSDFTNLEHLDCKHNLLTSIILPTNCANLKTLDLSNNDFLPQDLSFLVAYTNLWDLALGNNNPSRIVRGIYNKFTGSLDYLGGMEKLNYLSISNTDLNEVDINKLPKSLKEIRCFARERPDCKLTGIIPRLEKCKWGFCKKCLQPNAGEEWCHSCQEKEWQENIKNLTGQEVIEKFSQQQPSDFLGRKKDLQWIPYEKFTSIEKIGEGGFSKIYKAKWQGKSNKKWENRESDYIEIVLKSLNNSQNITLELLNEIANTSLFGDGSTHLSGIMTLYGISQDPETRNYVTVMPYMEEGNLRQMLQKRTNELSLIQKLKKLRDIAKGLSFIHNQNLTHKDFHSGNILNDHLEIYITDLGLSQPANYQKEEGKIFGVLPYVAPEVLEGNLHTQAGDIYSFGIIAYELFSNSYPYSEIDDMDLALEVRRGLRPKVDKLPVPQLLKVLIKECWETNTTKRPNSWELRVTISEWCEEIRYKQNTPFYQQYQDLEDEYDSFSQNTPYQIPPVAVVRSRLINTKEIDQLFQKIAKVQDISNEVKVKLNEDNQEQIQILKSKLKSLKIVLDKEKQEKFDQFIILRKEFIKDKKSKKKEMKAFKEIIKDNLSEELINKIEQICDELVELELENKIEEYRTLTEHSTN